MAKKEPHDVVCGQRLRECREEKGMTQAKLAEAVYQLPENRGKERSANQIGYLERGTRPISLEYAALLSKVLGVREEYLLGKDDHKNIIQQFQKMVDDVQLEGFLLYTGLSAYAELAGYTITAPPLMEGRSFEEIFTDMKNGYQISKDGKTIAMSMAEMNRFENEVFDFVELKFKHLFKEKED